MGDDDVWSMSEMDAKIPEKKLNAVSGGNVRSWRGPRTVSLQRCDHGFGFTLRHFIVYPPDVSTRSDSDGSDSGVPHGGEKFLHAETSALEPMDTIFVKHVKDGSPAQKAGLTTGDRVVSVNGETVAGKSYSQVVQLIQRSGSTLQLLVVPKEDDILQLYFPSTAYRSNPDDHRHQQEGEQRLCTNATQATSSIQAPFRSTTSSTTSVTTASSRQDLIAQSHPTSAKDTRTMVSSGVSTNYGNENATSAPFHGDVGRRRFSDLPSLFRNEVASVFPGRGVAPSSAGSLGPPRAGSTWSVATVGLGLGLGIGLNFGAGRNVANGDADRCRSAFDLSSPSTDACKTTVAGSSSTVTVYSVGTAPRFATAPSDGCSPSPSGLGSHSVGETHHPSLFPPLVPCPPAPEYLASAADANVCKTTTPPPGGSTTVSSRESSTERLDATTDSIINRLKASFEKKEEFLLRSTPPGSGATPVDIRMLSSAPSSLNGPIVREYYPHPHKFTNTPQWPPSSLSGGNTGAVPGSSSPSTDSFTPHSSRQTTHSGSIRAAPDGEAEDLSLCRLGKAFVSNLSRIQENIPTTDQRENGDHLRPSQILPLVESANGTATSNTSSSSSCDSPPLFSLSSSSLQKNSGSRTVRYSSLRKANSLDSDLLPPRASSAGTSCAVTGSRLGNGVSSSSGSTASMDCTVDAGRVSALHLVSQRARQFEMGALQQEANNRMNLYRNELARLTTRGQTPSVSDRAAQFESLSTSQETLASESDYSQSPRSKPSLTGLAAASADSWKDVGLSKMVLQRSLDSQLTRSNGPCLNSAQGSNVDVPSSSSSVDDDLHRHRAVRQNSYLAAVKAPYAAESHAVGSVAPMASGASVDPSVPPGRVVLRRKAFYEDGVHLIDDKEDSDGRLMRRVSYLRATSSSDDASAAERNARWALKEDDGEDETGSDADGKLRRGRPPHRQYPAVAPRDNHRHHSCQFQNHHHEQDQRRLQSQSETGKPNGGIHQGAPRSQSTQKLKAFFGERVADTSEKSPLSEACLSPVEVFKEAWLNCKVAACDGKRATDRSWKQTWTVLKGSCLALYRDKKDVAHQILATVDEQPIDLKSCQVDVANDYSKKKKHVFRIVTSSGSEYLLQAENGSDMQQWIRAIQDGLDVNGKGVISQGIVLRKSALFESGTIVGGGSGHLSPQTGPKGIKKLTTFRNRSPTGHSPTSKTRKSSQGDDTSPKSKTWRGKMVKTIRKIHGTSSPVALQPGVTVGVPLEDCPPSAVNEFVPLLVELCTSIVEARGLEVIGIYRVPGNTAAVSFLLDAVNHGFESLNLQDPKWSDVNVISSLLKAFFRKLPDPLVTCELYPHFIEASKADDPVQRMYDLKKMLHELPDHNYETLRYLIRHLQKVVAHSSVNKMEARNLAIVFGPTLVRASDDNMVTMVTDMSFQCRIVEMFITHANWFFSTDENEDVANQNFPLSEREAADVGVSRPISNQNQLLLNNLQKMEHVVHQGGESKLKDVTAKDLVSSIIGAANRKVRQKMKKHHHQHHQNQQTHHHLQQSSHRHGEPDLEERDIDREIELRLRRLEPDRGVGTGAEDRKSDSGGLKVERRHSEDSSTSSFSTSRTTSEDCTSPRKMSVDSLDGFQQVAGVPSRVPLGAGDKERAFCVVRQTSSSSSASLTGRLQTRSGTMAPAVDSTSLTITGVGGRPTGVRKDGDVSSNGTAVGDGVLKTYAGLSASMQERIRQFELETRALLKRDAQNRQKGQERRDLDRQRIEIEWQRAKRDMEQDDFLDRLADDPSVAKKISDITQKIQNLHNSHLRIGSEQWSPPSSSSSTASKGGSASSFEHDLDSLPFIDSTAPASSQKTPVDEGSPPSQTMPSNDHSSGHLQSRQQSKQPVVVAAQRPDGPSRRDVMGKTRQSVMKRVSSAENFVARGDDKEWRGRQSRARTRSCGRSSSSGVANRKNMAEVALNQCPTDSENAVLRATNGGSDLERMSKWCGSLDSLREFYETTIQEESSTGRAAINAPRQLHQSSKKSDTGSKNSDWVSRHPRVPPYQPPPAPPASSLTKSSGQKMDHNNKVPKESNRHHHYHQASVGNESTTSARLSGQELGYRPWSPQRGRRPISMEDVRFHRNENTLIKATLSTSSHTISTTSTTAVMTATITSKSSRATDPASSWCTVHDTSVGCPSFGHCQAASPSIVVPEKKAEGQKRVLQSVVCENGIKKGRATPISNSLSSQSPAAPLPHVHKSSHLRNLKRRHTVGGTKDFEKFRVLAGDRSPEDEHRPDQWLDQTVDHWRQAEKLSDDPRSVKSRLRRERTQISSPDLHGQGTSDTLLVLSSKCRPEKRDVTDRTLGTAVQVNESRTVRNDTKSQGSLESQV